MSFPNHVAGGFVFTGIFGSISGVNILENEWFMCATVFASVISDVDIPTSPVGKLFLPLSKWINRNHGHRTITHSLIFLGAVTFIVGLFESNFLETSSFTLITFFGILSHMMFDMMTVSGVNIFYPFANSLAVIPGDANLRFTSSNRKVELSIFTFFCLCFFFLTPLFESGFWTSYNRTFGTPNHLFSEFNKSSDLLEVDYTYRIASDEFKGKGLVIESNENGCTLLQNETKWLQLDKEKMIIDNVTPSHTGREWGIEQINFVGISSDSLNRLFANKTAIRTEIHSNNQFTFLFNDKQETATVAKAVYFHDARVKEVGKIVEKDIVTFQSNPRIKTLLFQIKNLEKSYREQVTTYQNHLAEKRKLESKIRTEKDLFQRETAVKELAQMRTVDEPKSEKERIELLRAQVREIKEADSQNYNSRLVDAENEYNSALPDDSHYTGYLKFVTIEPPTQLSEL